MLFPVKHPHLPPHLVDISMQQMGSGTGTSMQMGQKCVVTSLPPSYGGVCLCVSQKLWEGKRKGSILFAQRS